jgi:hypothetical protein
LEPTNIRLMGPAAAVFSLLLTSPPDARSQSAPQESLAPCPGSAPEPTQSTTWSIAFCNRTGHDVVLEFHDNDCPAKDWSRRGDVYQRTVRNGESKTFPLCYANEPVGAKLSPGVPMVRLPGGKGVVTTWSVVGDCGERSKALNLDARSFYDRGEYKSGIILLQYPAGASHCVADGSSWAAGTSSGASGLSSAAGPSNASGASSTSGTSGAAAASTTAQPSTGAPVAPHSPNAAPPAAAVNNRGSGAPAISATIDTKDMVGRTVQVFSKDGAGYKCSVNLALTFTDGGSWNDHANIDITSTDANAPITTRRYLKSVSKVQVTSSKCAPQ